MKQPTTTLTVAAPSTTLALAAGYITLLEENGNPLLAEDGSTLYADQFASSVALTIDSPTVALVLRRNA